ncbi:MAG: hypothetical protein R2795_23605 [Saprospiraceae bacterium]
MKSIFFLLVALLTAASSFAQAGIIRGNVIDEETGEPVIYAPSCC